MANLDPTLLPVIVLPDGPAHGVYGERVIDRETMQAVVDAVGTGDFVISPHWEEPVSDVSDADLTGVFLRHLDDSPLSAFASVLAHRRLALITAIKTVGETGARQSTLEVAPGDAPRLIGNLETFLLAEIGPLTAEFGAEKALMMTSELLLLTSKATARLLGVSEPTLSRWRAGGTGPAFTRIGTTERGTRYPYVAVRSWLITLMSA